MDNEVKFQGPEILGSEDDFSQCAVRCWANWTLCTVV